MRRTNWIQACQQFAQVERRALVLLSFLKCAMMQQASRFPTWSGLRVGYSRVEL